MRRIAIRFPLKDGNCEKQRRFVMSCTPVNTDLMKPPAPSEESESAACDQHEGLFWLRFMAGCHLKRIPKSSFLITLIHYTPALPVCTYTHRHAAISQALVGKTGTGVRR